MPAPIHSCRDLIVYQKSPDLVEFVYDVVSRLPRQAKWTIGDQAIRAAVSIPLNIAEGYGREATADSARFLAVARGSANETMALFDVEVRLRLSQKTMPPEANGLQLRSRRCSLCSAATPERHHGVLMPDAHCLVPTEDAYRASTKSQSGAATP